MLDYAKASHDAANIVNVLTLSFLAQCDLPIFSSVTPIMWSMMHILMHIFTYPVFMLLNYSAN